MSKKLMPSSIGLADQRTALLLGQGPGMIAALGHAEGHAAEAERRDFEAGITQISVLHRCTYKFNDLRI